MFIRKIVNVKLFFGDITYCLTIKLTSLPILANDTSKKVTVETLTEGFKHISIIKCENAFKSYMK